MGIIQQGYEDGADAAPAEPVEGDLVVGCIHVPSGFRGLDHAHFYWIGPRGISFTPKEGDAEQRANWMLLCDHCQVAFGGELMQSIREQRIPLGQHATWPRGARVRWVPKS